MEEEKGAVCVTGGTGHIASCLIKRLLQHGYNVRATVRSDPERKRDISHLTNLPGASERLKIFHADLDEPDSFNAAIDGCVGVFHVAHPMDIQGKEPEDIIVKRSVEGTLGILKACVNSKTVKRVVYTSSVAAAMFAKRDVDIVDESSWTDIDYCRSFGPHGINYTISKTLTEKAALEFAEQHGLDLVTVVNSLTLGPFICPNFPISVYLALALILGNKDQYRFLAQTHMVHIDDLVDAHIFLFECPKAEGRYICSSVKITIQEMAKFLSTKYPELQMPTMESLAEVERSHEDYSPSSKKLMDLGFKFKYGLDEMFDGAIQCCKDKGFL